MDKDISVGQEPLKVNIIVPIVLFLMIFSLVIDNSFKIISPELVNYFGVSASTVSWQVTLAGLIIGIGAVVYAALSDSISIRNLLITGIILICAGSLFGYIVHDNYWLIVVARIVQAAGLGATETLYLIIVAKYLDPKQKKKYMGFSTMSFSLATVIGTLTGGFISTYLQWEQLFLIPLFSLLLIPFLWKYLPNDSKGKSNVDFIGMLLITSVATSILLCISSFDILSFIGFIVCVFLFLLYISKNKKAFITINFFKNKLYVLILLIVLAHNTTYSAFSLNTFSFLLTDIYNVQLDVVSMMFIPACLSASIVGALSGKIGNYLSSKQCIYIAICVIIITIISSIFLIGQAVTWFVIPLIVFLCCDSFMYAPLMETSLRKIPVEKAGTALGFYNLCINIAMSAGFTYSALFIDNQDISLNITNSVVINHYAGVLIGVSILPIVGLFIYHFFVAKILKEK